MAKRTRPINGVQRHYTWALYPTPGQAVILRNQAAACADLWNALLEMCEQRYQRSRQGRHVTHCARCAAETERSGKHSFCNQHRLPTEFDMSYWITELREDPDWRALSVCTPRRVAESLAEAFAAFFRRAKKGEKKWGYPRYKSRRFKLSIPHRCASGCKIVKSGNNPLNWHLYAKGVHNIHARGILPAAVSEWTDVDLIFRNGRWEASASVVIDPRRQAGLRPTVVRFDLMDCLATVNGTPFTPPELINAKILQDKHDAMKSDFDRRKLELDRRERREAKVEIGLLSSRIARIRNNALHVWTSRVVAGASALTVVTPAVKEHTASPRGSIYDWGANVGTVSELNRSTLSYAPAMAVEMLKYKAQEAGIRCDVIEDNRPKIAAGGDLVRAGKELRKAQRIIRRCA